MRQKRIFGIQVQRVPADKSKAEWHTFLGLTAICDVTGFKRLFFPGISIPCHSIPRKSANLHLLFIFYSLSFKQVICIKSATDGEKPAHAES